MKKTRCALVGFAPDSRDFVARCYDDPTFAIFGINELMCEMPQLSERADGWFQLHGYEPPTVRDPEHSKRLARMKCPVYMWEEHPDIPNSVRYPREEVFKFFDSYGEGMAPEIPEPRDRIYLNNSISIALALLVMSGFEEIHVFGVNMAQDVEMAHQRPSCEFFLGWARGLGIKIYLPIQSDLLRSWMIYGLDDGCAQYQKLYAREEELQGRLNGIRNDRANLQNQAQNALSAENQMAGALEDVRYLISSFGPIKPQVGGVDQPIVPPATDVSIVAPSVVEQGENDVVCSGKETAEANKRDDDNAGGNGPGLILFDDTGTKKKPEDKKPD